MNQKTLNKAFSLIELSIVILIIGILVAGVTKGGDLYSQIKLTAARSVTNSSSINTIPDLRIWLETTKEESLTTNDGNQPNQGSFISSWNDIKLSRPNDKINVTQATSSNQPIYVKNGIGGLPSLQFDGINDVLENLVDMPINAGDDSYTMVAVVNIFDPSGGDIAIGQGTNSHAANRSGMMYFNGTNQFGFAGFANDYVSISYANNTEYIAIVIANHQLANNITLYLNSNSETIGTTNADNSALNIAGERFVIGSASYNAHYHDGLISEVMIFDRNLKDSEVAQLMTT